MLKLCKWNHRKSHPLFKPWPMPLPETESLGGKWSANTIVKLILRLCSQSVTWFVINCNCGGGGRLLKRGMGGGSERGTERRGQLTHTVSKREALKPILNWAYVCSTNYDSFLNWTFSSPNMVWTVRQILLCSQLACNEMQALAWTCSMIENVGSI